MVQAVRTSADPSRAVEDLLCGWWALLQTLGAVTITPRSCASASRRTSTALRCAISSVVAPRVVSAAGKSERLAGGAIKDAPVEIHQRRPGPPLTTSARRSRLPASAHVDVGHLDRVVSVAEPIPGWDIWLNVAGGVGRACAHLCAVRLWSPATRTTSPAIDTGLPGLRFAARHSPSPVRLRSTFVTGPVPDQAFPRTVDVPGGEGRAPGAGSVIRARTRMSVTGSCG